MNKKVNLTTENLNRIFPFYFLLNDELKIISFGKSFEKLFSNPQNKLFSDLLSVFRPQINTLTTEQLVSLTNQLVILKTTDERQIVLRGQFEKIDNDNAVLFLGAPWFDSTYELNESNLTLNDYAPHNPLIDLLHILKTKEIVNEELKELIEKVTHQKNELIAQNKKIAEITASLEKSNNRFEYVNKATSEAIWDWNIITGELYNGEGFNKLFGNNISDKPQNIDYWESRIHPDDLKRITEKLALTIDSEESTWSDEYRYLKADGSFAFVSDKGFIVRDENGNAIRMLGAINDNTRLKKEELRLKLLESVITNTNDGVLITEAIPGNPIIYINEAFAKMSGYSLEELEGQNPKIFQGPKSDVNELNKIRSALKNHESCEVTTINYRKDGTEFWNNLYISPVANEKGIYTHWISIQKNVTELKKAQEELNIQKKFTEDVLNNIPTDIAVFDPNHNYLFVNPHGIKNTEIREWIINKNDFDYAKMRNIETVMAEKRWQLFEKAVTSKQKVEWIDEHITPEGSRNYVQRNFYPYFEENKLKYVIGYGIDITTRKTVEIQLNEALSAFQKSNSELEQFAYVASHDLQEPLRMVTSFLTQLEKKYKDQLDEKAKEYIFFAVDGAKRMRQIILDLLEYSRAGKSEEKVLEVNINDIVNEIKILLASSISEINATIISDELPKIIGHASPIRQIFQNLIGNSLKYYRPDTNPIVKISVQENPNTWKFTVSDNGIGIEKQYFEKIFVIFQRLHNKDEYLGTGIGLAITKKIIENMGGKIWVDSVENVGSNFHFELPK